MPISLEILRDRGVTQERLAKLFTPGCAPDPASFDPAKEGRARITKEDVKRCEELQKRMRSRVQEGQTRNLKNWRVYYALDLARNTAFRQVSPTLLNSLLGDGDMVFPEGDDIFKKLDAFGLNTSSFVEDVMDEKTGGKTKQKRVHAPAFFHVLVGLCKSYGDMVWSKLTNERDQYPLFKYEPSYPTTLNKARCEALTNRVQVMATQYSFFEVLKQAILNMVHYGTCLQFVKEEWHSETQVVKRKATEDDVKAEKRNAEGEIVKVGDLIEAEVVEREGLRYHLPHPTRTFRDLAHGCYTFNSDCGAMFAGYWQIVRYRDICGIGYWNTDKVKQGIKDLTADYWPFFQTVYAACTLKLPTAAAAASEAGLGVSQLDSERQLSNQFYGTDQNDQGVLITEYFEKLKPSENGLGDYTGYVWFRFVLGGDGCTILYAAPLPYVPILYYGYNPDESQAQNSSITLEVLPFQDQFGMMLSQIILSAKQNLANLSFVNTDIMDEKDIQKLENKSEKLYRTVNLIGRSFKKISKAIGLRKYEQEDVIQSWTLPKANTAELVNVLKTILDVLDRVVQVSSQEMNRQASHEQPAAEINALAQAGQERNRFIGKGVDLPVDAWKRQAYLGVMAYGDEDFYAHIPADPPLTDVQLKVLGFVPDTDNVSPDDEYMRVKLKKDGIIHPLYEFASTAGDLNRKEDVKTAAAMAQVMQSLGQFLANPAAVQRMGVKQIFDLTNQIAHLAGVDRDFNLRPVGPVVSPEQQKQQAADQLKQMIDLISKVVDEKLKPDLAPLLKMLKEAEAVIALCVHTLQIPQPLVQQAIATVDKPQPNQPQPDNASSQPGGAPPG